VRLRGNSGCVRTATILCNHCLLVLIELAVGDAAPSGCDQIAAEARDPRCWSGRRWSASVASLSLSNNSIAHRRFMKLLIYRGFALILVTQEQEFERNCTTVTSAARGVPQGDLPVPTGAESAQQLATKIEPLEITLTVKPMLRVL